MNNAMQAAPALVFFGEIWLCSPIRSPTFCRLLRSSPSGKCRLQVQALHGLACRRRQGIDRDRPFDAGAAHAVHFVDFASRHHVVKRPPGHADANAGSKGQFASSAESFGKGGMQDDPNFTAGSAHGAISALQPLRDGAGVEPAAGPRPRPNAPTGRLRHGGAVWPVTGQRPQPGVPAGRPARAAG